jgi:hypothetical protein
VIASLQQEDEQLSWVERGDCRLHEAAIGRFAVRQLTAAK